MGLDAGSIEGRLTLDDSGFAGAMKESIKSTSVMEGALLAAAAATVLVAGKIAGLTQETATYRDELTKTSRAAGVSVKELSGLQFAAEQSGIATKELAKNMQRLLDEETLKDLKAFGIAQKDNTGAFRESSDILKDVADKIKNLKSPAEQAAAAVKLFGARGAKMVNILKDGRTGIKEMTDQAKAMGLVFDKEAGEAAERFNDANNRLKRSMDGLIQSITGTIIKLLDGAGVSDIIAAKIQSITMAWNELDDETKEFIVTLTAVTGGLALLGGAIVIVTKLWPIASVAAQLFASKVTVSIAAATAGISLLVAAVAVAITALISRGEQVAGIWAPVKRAVDGLKTSFEQAFKAANDFVKNLTGDGRLKEARKEFNLIEIASQVVAAAILIVVKNVQTWFNVLRRVGRLLGNIGTLAVAVAKRDIGKITEAWGDVKVAAGDAFTETLNDAKKTVTGVIDIFKTGMKKVGEDAKKEIKKNGGPGTVIGESIKKGVVKSFGPAFVKALMQTIGQVVDASFQMAANAIKKTQGQFNLFADVWGQRWSDLKDEEIKAMLDAEDEKIRILQNSSAEQLAIIDAEFARKMQILKDERDARLVAIEEERIARDLFAEENSERQAQEILLQATNRDDAIRLSEETEKEFQERLRRLERETAAEKKAERDKAKADIAKAEEDKKKLLEDANKAREEEEKRHAKVRAAVQFGFELAAFRVAQNRALSSARLQFAQAIMSSVTTGLTFGPAAPVAIAALTGLSTAAFAASIAAISSTPPPLPPAILFARDGALIPGFGGGDKVPLMAEQGELIVDKQATRRIIESIDPGNPRNGGAQIIFQPGAFNILGSLDSDAADKIAQAITERQGLQIHSVVT